MDEVDGNTKDFIVDVIASFGTECGLTVLVEDTETDISTDGVEEHAVDGKKKKLKVFAKVIKEILTETQRCRLVQAVYGLLVDLVELGRSAVAVAKRILEDEELTAKLLQVIKIYLSKYEMSVYSEPETQDTRL